MRHLSSDPRPRCECEPAGYPRSTEWPVWGCYGAPLGSVRGDGCGLPEISFAATGFLRDSRRGRTAR
jgi:hypothetical protein